MVFNDYNWFIGVTLAVGANVISNLGLNFQKKAHSNREKHEKKLANHQTIHKYQNAKVKHKSNKKKNRKSRKLQRQNGGYRDSIPSHSKSSENMAHPEHHNDNSNESSHEIIISKEQEKDIHPIPNTILSSDKHVNSEESNANGSYVCDFTWLLGLFLQIFGALLDFAALGYAPQSVVAPLGALTLVVNVMLAPCMHNEKASKKTLFATFTIIAGSGITVAFSAREDSVKSIDEVFELYENLSFLMYASITGGFLVIGWLMTQYYVYLSRERQRRYEQYYYKQHRFVIAAISGTMGAQNVLFAKSVSTLVVVSIKGDGLLFVHWETYLLLLGLVMTIYFQLRWLNSGLKRFSALYVAPTFQAFWITVSVMGGLVVYQEYAEMTTLQKVIFPLGVIVTIFGVCYLTTQASPKEYKDKKHRRRESTKSLKSLDANANANDIIANPHKKGDYADEIGGQNGLFRDDHPSNVVAPVIAIGKVDDHDKCYHYGQHGYLNDELSHDIDELSPINSEREEDYDYECKKHISDYKISKKRNHQRSNTAEGFMDLIKNLGDISDASIITGSSLGKMLLDPNGTFSNINVGANEEDEHFKGILSPKISNSDELIQSDDMSSNEIEFVNNKHEVVSDELAPHEVVWKSITSIFHTDDGDQNAYGNGNGNGKGEILNGDKALVIDDGYVSMENDEMERSSIAHSCTNEIDNNNIDKSPVMNADDMSAFGMDDDDSLFNHKSMTSVMQHVNVNNNDDGDTNNVNGNVVCDTNTNDDNNDGNEVINGDANVSPSDSKTRLLSHRSQTPTNYTLD